MSSAHGSGTTSSIGMSSHSSAATAASSTAVGAGTVPGSTASAAAVAPPAAPLSLFESVEQKFAAKKLAFKASLQETINVSTHSAGSRRARSLQTASRPA